MRVFSKFAAFVCLAASPLAADPPECLAEGVRVGVASVDITPPMGIPMAGYYHARGADGVLDPLYSKALVIESGEQRAALVGLDIISITRSITDAARAEAEKATGIKGDRIMIFATHAHTGPDLIGRGTRSSEAAGQNPIAAEYTRELPQRIAESIRLANERLEASQLSVAEGRCENLAFNRRYYMRDGSVGWNPGKLNKNIVLPAGPSDPAVGLLVAESPSATGPAQTIATCVNFAMHPDTTGGSKISADWPGALSRALAAYHGPEHFTLLANGTCGNINHVDFSWRWPQSGPGEQNRIAAILAGAVFQAYKSLEPLPAGVLQAKSEIVELSLPPISPEQIAEAKEILATTKDDRGASFMNLVRAHRALQVAGRNGQPHRVEVQVISLGRDLAWVALPGEVFVELGLAIKKRSPFAHTMIAELANENIGYIPDRRSYDEGNYEAESARCAAGSGEKLVDAAATILDALHAGAQP